MATGNMVSAIIPNVGDDKLNAKRLQLSRDVSKALVAFANAMLSNHQLNNDQPDSQASSSAAGTTEESPHDVNHCSTLMKRQKNLQDVSLEGIVKPSVIATYSDNGCIESASKVSQEPGITRENSDERVRPLITLNDDPTDLLSVSKPGDHDNREMYACRPASARRRKFRRFELAEKKLRVKFEDGKVVVFKTDITLPEIKKGEVALHEVRKIWELKKEFAGEAERALRAARVIDVCVAKFARLTEMLCDAKVTLAEEMLHSSERGLPTTPSFMDNHEHYLQLQEETWEMRQTLLHHLDDDGESATSQARLLELYFTIEEHGAKYKGAAKFMCKLGDIGDEHIEQGNKIAEDYRDVIALELE